MEQLEEERELVGRAMAGNLKSMERLLQSIQDGVFGLAVKFLWHPEDAEDATQEILTHLHTFRFESRFSTWSYRVAVNYLLNVRRSRAERLHAEQAFIDPDRVADAGGPSFVEDVEQQILAGHVRVACSHGMLMALEREDRMVFLLGVVMGISGADAARIMDISPVAYRKRLSRARQRMQTFVEGRCGLIRSSNACRCDRRVRQSQEAGILQPYLDLSAELQRSGRYEATEMRMLADQKQLNTIGELFANKALSRTPERVLDRVRALFRSDKLHVLRETMPDVN